MIGSNHICQCEPTMGSETFARTMAKWPGVFCLLGTKNLELGTGSPIHTAKFDIDDNVLVYGIAAHICYATCFLNADITPPVFPGAFSDIYKKLDLPEDQIMYLQGKIDDYKTY